jgi:hypothetical protein
LENPCPPARSLWELRYLRAQDVAAQEQLQQRGVGLEAVAVLPAQRSTQRLQPGHVVAASRHVVAAEVQAAQLPPFWLAFYQHSQH